MDHVVPAELAGHVLVCGLSTVGLRVVEQLRAAGEQVILVDDAPSARLLRVASELDIVHVVDNPRRASVLLEAGLERAAAVICTDDEDLDNLEIALQARRIREDIRVVVHLRNAAVGRAVGALTGVGSVLDVASIAAPDLAEACLDLHSRTVDIGGVQFVLQELTTNEQGTLRELYGDLVPIAIVNDADGRVRVCPGRDAEVGGGDRVVVLATDDELSLRHMAVSDSLATVPRETRRATVRRYVRGFVSESDRSFRVTLLVLLAVALVSIVVLAVGYRDAHGNPMTPLDAAYFTTETLTTVGFGDFAFADQHAWLRIWAIALMIIGAAVVTVLYAMLTNLLVSRRIAQSLGRQLATRMSGHVVLVGLGSIGLRVLEHLVAVGQPVVVLENDEDNRYLPRARALHVPVVIGDATVPSGLDGVNLTGARAVAVLTSNDLVNIETGLAVTDILGAAGRRVPVVLRVFDRDLAQTIEDSFGFSWARSTTALAAPWFVGAALGLDILQTFYVEQQPMLIGRLTIAHDGQLAGRAMAELSARIRVIALRRAGQTALEHPPRRDTRFAGGDEAYLVGPYEELLRVLRRDTDRRRV